MERFSLSNSLSTPQESPNTRTAHISVRFDANIASRLFDVAKWKGMSRSDYVRKVVEREVVNDLQAMESTEIRPHEDTDQHRFSPAHTPTDDGPITQEQENLV